MFNFNKNKAFSLTSKKPKGNNPLKKGFTLIEFIIVMAIIGILVLLASPKFLDYVDKAKLTQIKNDIKVVENIATSYLADNDFNANTLEEIDIKEGLSLTSNSLNDTIILEGKTFDITKFVDSKLKGQFIINEDYEVIYIDDQIINKEPENSYDEFLATDEDFEFELYSNSGYYVNGKRGYFKYIGDKKIVKIPHAIQGHEMTSYHKMFEGSNVEKVISDNLNIIDMSSMFALLESNKLDLSNLNTSKVENMSFMFFATNITNLDLSNFNTSNVTNMEYMFNDSHYESLDLSSFDTKNVTNMESMFHFCNSLKSLNVSSFNTEKVTNMWSMFRDCSSLNELDLSSFNTENVTNMRLIFNNCSNLESGIAKNQTEADKFNELLSKEIFKPKQ